MDWLLQSYLCHSAFHHNGYQGLSLVGRVKGWDYMVMIVSEKDSYNLITCVLTLLNESFFLVFKDASYGYAY